MYLLLNLIILHYYKYLISKRSNLYCRRRARTFVELSVLLFSKFEAQNCGQYPSSIRKYFFRRTVPQLSLSALLCPNILFFSFVVHHLQQGFRVFSLFLPALSSVP